MIILDNRLLHLYLGIIKWQLCSSGNAQLDTRYKYLLREDGANATCEQPFSMDRQSMGQ